MYMDMDEWSYIIEFFLTYLAIKVIEFEQIKIINLTNIYILLMMCKDVF